MQVQIERANLESGTLPIRLQARHFRRIQW